MKKSTGTLFLVAIIAAGSFSSSADLGQFGSNPNLIGRGAIKSGGPPKDGIPALTSPKFVSHRDVPYLKPDDLVIGINISGEYRAYPLRILIWHEIINDTIAGVPVVVTYCPLCHSSLVFSRLVGGRVREFGVSGLLYNSNVLMYDRQPFNLDSSLWSQTEMRAVTGPAAKEALTLDLLPSDLTTWRDWLTRYPSTKVLSDDTGHLRSYHGNAYTSYFDTDTLMFTAKTHSARPSGFRNKEPMIVVYAGDQAKAYAFKDVVRAAKEGVLVDRVGERLVAFVVIDGGDSVRAESADGGPPVKTAYQFWFSLAASDPGAEIFRPENTQ